MKVLLQDVIDALEQTDSETEFYYNIDDEIIYGSRDGEIFTHNVDDAEDLLCDSIPLPKQYERNDYAIMEDFINQVEDKNAHEWLTNSIRGRGAFRMFRATLNRFDLVQDWYNFKDEAYEEIAIDWCNQYGIEYDASEVEYDEEIEEEVIVPHSNKITTSIVDINKHNLASILYMATDYSNEIKHINDPERVQEELASLLTDKNHIYSLTLNGKSIGYIVLVDYDDKYLVHSLYVRKEDRRKGYGSKLLKHAEDVASNENKNLVMHTKPNNEVYINLLKKNGYANVDYIQIRKNNL